MISKSIEAICGRGVVRLLMTPLLVVVVLVPAYAQDGEGAYREVSISEVQVTAQRRLADIGESRDDVDSALLRSSVSLSMADVLMAGSGVYVKHSGRASLSTVSIRGASATHTQVTWNGLKVNNPMMGQVDFSTIPSYFVDEATVLYGSTSLGEVSGGLGGAVCLSSAIKGVDGMSLEYVQGIGSFSTFDEYLCFAYGGARLQGRTQLLVATSENDFPYINRDRKENIYDEEHNIVAQYYPKERNSNGQYRDIHLMQQLEWRTSIPLRVGFSCWYANQERERPLLSSSYVKGLKFENRHREESLRSVATAHYVMDRWQISCKTGIQSVQMRYDYRRDPGSGVMVKLIDSYNEVVTTMGRINISGAPSDRLLVKMTIEADYHDVVSRDRDVLLSDGTATTIGYDKSRTEVAIAGSAIWRIADPVGVRLTLREECVAGEWLPLMGTVMAEYDMIGDGQWLVKGSVSRNYNKPSLNDMYYQPGGNPQLKSEEGYSWDIGLSYTSAKTDDRQSLKAELTWFDSDINNSIMWLPTTKGFFSPRNVKRVHSYGVEVKANYTYNIRDDWQIALRGNYVLVKALNKGEPMSAYDESQGKQMPYIPEHTSNAQCGVSWRSWNVAYCWSGYSERYTMSSNAHTYTGQLKPYGVTTLRIEKAMQIRQCKVQAKVNINNLFDKEYQSILSRPMPGRHYEVVLGVRIE